MIKYVAAFALALLLACETYADVSIKPTLSKLIETNKTKLYIECYGTKGPSIVVNAGFGVAVSDGGWEKVIESLHTKNRICFYDRANVGQSEKHQGTYDLDTIVEQQNMMLSGAGINPPFIFVGHSYGAYPIKLFNHRYPEKVSGILLVDPSLYGQFKSHINKWDAVNDTYDTETESRMKQELARWHGEPTNIEGINMKVSSAYIENSNGFGAKPYVLLWRKNAIWQPPATMPENWHPAVWERIKQSYKTDLEKMQTLSSHINIVFANTNEHFIHKHEPEIVIKQINYLLDAVNNSAN